MARTDAQDLTTEFPHLVLDVSQRAINKIATDTDEQRLTLELVARSGTVQVLHHGTQIGEADPYDAADLTRRIPMLEQGVRVAGILIRRRDGSSGVRYSTAQLYKENTVDSGDEFMRWMASTRRSLQQIQRWVGWLVALVIIYMTVEFLGGVVIALMEADAAQPGATG